MNVLNPHPLCRSAARLQSLMACGILTLFLAPSPASAQTSSSSSRATSRASQNIVVEFDRLHRGELAVDGFELTERTRLDLYAVGAAPGNSDDLSAYAWIIDAETRQPVWVMEERDTDRYQRSSDLREIDDQLTLQPGRYEAYYFVGQTYNFNGTINIKDLEGFEEFFEELGDALAELGEELGEEIEDAFDDDDDDTDRNDRWRDRLKRNIRDELERDRNRDWRFGLSERDLDELRFEVTADRSSFTKFDPERTNYELAIADFTKVGDDERLRKGFTLSRETTLKVRSCGEYSESGNIFVDYGWIVDANTRERVWEMDKWSTRYAGGARKNRFADEEITLPAGDYLVYFMTDDSHSFVEWNAPPPYDPLFYGLLVSTTDKSALSSVSEYDYSPERTEVFALDRIRNDRFESQGFTLKERTQLHVYALGEFAFNEFADYAYIEDVETMELVWEMTEDNTTHAGGGTKNRMFDDVITLPAGSYMAHYTSDGSHSYNSWNTSKPFDPTKWGITVYGVGKNFDKSSIDLFSDMPTGSEMLVDLTRVCDDEFLTKSLTIDNPTAVRIFALGEGSSGRMYDYGWIEEAKTGKVVWKMRYRKTRHAGGASKNRMANVVVELEPGEYDVVFVTDGSHSFCRFNASKPNYPQKWGITVSKK